MPYVRLRPRLGIGVSAMAFYSCRDLMFILVINSHDRVIGPDAPGDRVALSVLGVELFQESEKTALRLDVCRSEISPFTFLAVRVNVICSEIAKQKKSPLATKCAISGVVATMHGFILIKAAQIASVAHANAFLKMRAQALPMAVSAV